MKTLATYLKLALFFLVFIQVRILKSVMFWKPMPEFTVWLYYLDEDGKNPLVRQDVSQLVITYINTGMVIFAYWLTGSWLLSILIYGLLSVVAYYIQKRINS